MPARRGLQRWLLVAVFACSAALYAATIDRGLDLGDYGDFQTVPYILGIAYPPGFPGYTLLGWLWSHGLPVGSVALRLNVLSVVAAAATNVSFAALLLELDVAPLAAAVAALLFGTTYQSWTHAGAASAHEVGTALLVASLFFAVRWVRFGHGYVLTSAATLYALSIATDSSTVLALPGLALIFSCRAPTKSERWLPALCACIVIAGAYAYLPLRSGYVATHGLDPTRALGLNEPDQFFDHHHPATLHNFVLLTTGAASG
ncbi:MAG: DUF2723 domain-containing protein, partial [Candidatus Eremiobacteraeota bacterium]|nr:DUF2723 domain-containing protein [Candidatus Eremiobacteraeota bacterium]